MKTEFFIHWDGLRTKEENRVLVLAATNRPFDLDEAVIRRLPRRFMVNLPDSPNREKILRVILADEHLSPEVDLKAIADRTNGYSGSDLKNLCAAAAYCPIRELIEREKKERGLVCSSADIRPLKMEDLLYAQKQVCSSAKLDSSLMQELVEWNEAFGEGGNGSQNNNKHLSYFM
ncbi:katanin p60 ATPase-containing subunit [Trifolium pratense]|uniref:Katanin p60 ATPase-containing subunit n=1 Tax=Trifolium pratense TaxID=57577 RepID=A0A2K3P9L9_TRIPR|nr:katanin p60 ATPase-containing subunit [Trifolium pratense]